MKKYLLLGISLFLLSACSSTPPELTTLETPSTEPPVTQGVEEKPEVKNENVLAIDWLKPEKIENLGLYKKPNEKLADDLNKDTEYYRIGKVKDGLYKDAEIILLFTDAGLLSLGHTRLIKQGTVFTILKKYSVSDPYNDNYSFFDQTKVTATSDLQIPELDFPVTFQNEKGASFELDTYVYKFFDDKNMKKAFTDKKLGDVYTTKEANTDETIDYFDQYGFYIKAPDSTVWVYKYIIPFLSKENIPNITWNDGPKNTDQYQATAIGGCGSFNYADVSDLPSEELEAAGKTPSGDPVSILKNQDHPLLKDAYENKYYVYPDQKKIPYQEFIAKKPFFFWKDPFDRLIKFSNNLFVSPVECGKPVIYLYPEETTVVSVKLDPKGGFSYSEPLYGNGWLVQAKPNGQLTELKSGNTYPYLFWEGRGGIYETPKKGFVVEQANVPSFLLEKLTLLGLTEQEQKDFLEFWEPRMQSAPYYFVTFMGNQVMDRLAPLSINPKPDTIIRVLMDFTALKEPISVEGFEIRTPERRGFMVVEWGGVLR